MEHHISYKLLFCRIRNGKPEEENAEEEAGCTHMYI